MSPHSHPLVLILSLIRAAWLRFFEHARGNRGLRLAGALALAACGTTDPVASTPANLHVFAAVVPSVASIGHPGDSIRIRVAAENREPNAVRIDLGESDRNPFSAPQYPNRGASFGYQVFRVEAGAASMLTGARAIPPGRYFAIEAQSYRATDFYLHLAGEYAVVLPPGTYEVHPFFNSNQNAQPVRFEVVP